MPRGIVQFQRRQARRIDATAADEFKKLIAVHGCAERRALCEPTAMPLDDRHEFGRVDASGAQRDAKTARSTDNPLEQYRLGRLGPDVPQECWIEPELRDRHGR